MIQEGPLKKQRETRHVKLILISQRLLLDNLERVRTRTGKRLAGLEDRSLRVHVPNLPAGNKEDVDNLELIPLATAFLVTTKLFEQG